MDEVLGVFAANLRHLRLERALTQDELADRAAMDASELRRFESARRDPGIRVLLRLSRGLDVTPSDLLKDIK